MYELKISKNVYNNYNLCLMHLRLKDRKKAIERFNWVTNDKKLDNNIARAKSNIFNIVSYNKFEFFYTQTINSIYCRNDLDLLINKFRSINKKLRKLYNQDFYYLIIPEYHSDKKNWHLHGFLSSSYGLDTYINNNGFLSSFELDKIGWNSLSKIRSYPACCKYITKYITKEIALNIKKGEHFYYCSKGLKRSNLNNHIACWSIPPLHFKFKSDYVFKTEINEKDYYNFINTIDSIDRFHYYNINKMSVL